MDPGGPRIVHCDIEAEMAVLGAAFLGGTAVLDACEDERLVAEHFFNAQNAEVFRAMVEVRREGADVDVLTVSHQLGRRRLRLAGGRAHLDLLAGSVPNLAGLRGYCRIVREKAEWRARQEAIHRADAAAQVEDRDAWSSAVAAADHADALVEGAVDPVEDFIAWYQSDERGMELPFKRLTAASGPGLLPGDVTVIGGWPGFGKSILADMVREHAASKGASTHLYLSEMLAPLRTARWVAGQSGVAWERIVKRELTGEEWRRVQEVARRFPDKYDRVEGWEVERIARHLRRRRWDLAVVDTASRIPARDAQEVKHVSGTLADAALSAGTHLVLVLQLNLERAKTLKRPEPTGRDLLGGGAWYQDARNVIFVHRDQAESEGRVSVLPGGAVYADKMTHGNPDDSYVRVDFSPQMMRFLERAPGGAAGPASNGSSGGGHGVSTTGEKMEF